MQTCTWSNYQFGVYLQEGKWNDVGGIYIFASHNYFGRCTAHYIGQTNSFSTRLPFHERWAEAKRLGATHVHAMVLMDQTAREKIEQELIAWCRPPMNTQFNLDPFGVLGSLLANKFPNPSPTPFSDLF